MTLPRGRRSLGIGTSFIRSMDTITLPSGLQSLAFGLIFNQRMDMTLPRGPLSLVGGTSFAVGTTTLPSGMSVVQSMDLRKVDVDGNHRSAARCLINKIGTCGIHYTWKQVIGLSHNLKNKK